MLTSATALMLAAAATQESAGQGGAFESFFKALTLYLSAGVEAAAAVVIGLAALEATVRALMTFFTRSAHPATGHDPREAVRLRLGRWLAVALEFLLAADILRTAVAPTWNEIGQLAAIVVLRTALNYFLQKEIDTAEERRQRADTAPAPAPAPATTTAADRGVTHVV